MAAGCSELWYGGVMVKVEFLNLNKNMVSIVSMVSDREQGGLCLYIHIAKLLMIHQSLLAQNLESKKLLGNISNKQVSSLSADGTQDSGIL